LGLGQSGLARRNYTPPNKSMNSDPLTLGFVWLRQALPSLNGPVISDVRRHRCYVAACKTSSTLQAGTTRLRAMTSNTVKISKFLSLVLRHKPQTIGIELDANGWVEVNELLAKASEHGRDISKDQLDHVVQTNDKKRFAFSDDGSRIRASQGHSVSVDLEMQVQSPPAVLYHGTASRFLDRILAEGLKKMGRQHVHLSSTREVATKVGSRHGFPVILVVNCSAMLAEGHEFFLSENNVWLTDAVPRSFLTREA